jgi:hypothetical protein
MGREMGRWKVSVCLLVLSALVIGADIAVSNPEFHSSQRDALLGPVSATRPEQTQIGANAVLRPGLRVKRENSEGRRLPRRDSTTLQLRKDTILTLAKLGRDHSARKSNSILVGLERS